MKKLMYAITVACLISFVAVISCKKSSPIDCKAATDKITTTGNAYGADQSSANCKAYKSALQDYYNSSCANSLNAQDKADLKTLIDALTCP